MLTIRENQVMTMMARGSTYDEICDLLKIEISTVKTHVFNAKLKLNANNIKHAVAIVIRDGIVHI